MGSPFPTIELSDPVLEIDGLRHVTVRSPALGRRADVTIVQQGEGKPAPLVVLLHGVYSSHWALAMKGGAHRVLRRLVAAGEIRPMVLAMPSDGLVGDGSGYLQLIAADAESWIVDEVPQVADLALEAGLDGRVCIGGLSMGGYGALRLAGRFRDRYVAAAGMSSVTSFDQLRMFTAEVPRLAAPDAADLDLVEILSRGGAQLPRLSIDCGLSDPLLESNRRLHRALVNAGVNHQYHEYLGGHDWPYWGAHLADVLRFFESALVAAESGPVAEL